MIKMLDINGAGYTMIVFPFVIMRDKKAHHGSMVLRLDWFNKGPNGIYSIQLVNWSLEDKTLDKAQFQDEVDAQFESILEHGGWSDWSYWESML